MSTPFDVPVAVGVNLTSIIELMLAAIVRTEGVTENGDPFVKIELIVRATSPVFCTVIGK